MKIFLPSSQNFVKGRSFVHIREKAQTQSLLFECIVSDRGTQISYWGGRMRPAKHVFETPGFKGWRFGVNAKWWEYNILEPTVKKRYFTTEMKNADSRIRRSCRPQSCGCPGSWGWRAARRRSSRVRRSSKSVGSGGSSVSRSLKSYSKVRRASKYDVKKCWTIFNNY